MQNRRILVGFLAFLPFASACSRTLTREQAANLIRQSPVFTIVSGSTETRRELLSVTGLRHEGADTYADFDYFWSGDMPSARS
jgi:hypothetical protein